MKFSCLLLIFFCFENLFAEKMYPDLLSLDLNNPHCLYRKKRDHNQIYVKTKIESPFEKDFCLDIPLALFINEDISFFTPGCIIGKGILGRNFKHLPKLYEEFIKKELAQKTKTKSPSPSLEHEYTTQDSEDTQCNWCMIQ